MSNGKRNTDDLLEQLGAEPLEGSGFEGEIPDPIPTNGEPQNQSHFDPNSLDKPEDDDER
jgi:hypothetical protein